MKKTRIYLYLTLVTATWLVACAPSMKITSSWMNHETTGKNKYEKIFLLAMTSNMNARQTVENAQATAASAKDMATIKSSEVFSPSFLKHDPGKEAIIQKIRETGCDAVFTSALIKSTEVSHYVPGTSTYMPYPTYGYYGSFGGYYGQHNAIMYDPGYYTEDKTYFIESNLYDMQTGAIIWSVQSEAYNPSNLAAASKTYSEMLMKKLKEEGGLYRKN